jgi:hypothetical protein
VRAWLRVSEEGAARLGQASDPKNDAPPRIPKPRKHSQEAAQHFRSVQSVQFLLLPVTDAESLRRDLARYDGHVKPFKNVTPALIVEIFEM